MGSEEVKAAREMFVKGRPDPHQRWPLQRQGRQRGGPAPRPRPPWTCRGTLQRPSPLSKSFFISSKLKNGQINQKTNRNKIS